MNCPHCNKPIADHLMAASLGAVGGRKSRRKITKAQQAKMQAARARKKNLKNVVDCARAVY